MSLFGKLFNKKQSELFADAIWDNNIESAKYLLTKSIDINTANRHKGSLIHRAIENRSSVMVKILIDAGFDITERDANGKTPLSKAADYNNIEIINILIQNNVNVNQLNSDMNSTSKYDGNALHYAMYPEITEVLLKAGVNCWRRLKIDHLC